MNNKLDDTFVIMGIDPGTNIMGFGIIKVEKKEMRLIDMIEYKLPKSDDHNIKLSKIFKKTTELIKIHRPNYISIESPFFGKNVQSMLKLGRAQGVSIAAALNSKTGQGALTTNTEDKEPGKWNKAKGVLSFLFGDVFDKREL